MQTIEWKRRGILRSGALSMALAAATLASAGCSSVPGAVNPVEWYRGVADWFAAKPKAERPTSAGAPSDSDKKMEEAQSKPSPSLATVPERPVRQSTPAERQALTQGLVADRNTARYSDESLQPKTSSAAPGPAAPPRPAAVAVPAPSPAPPPAAVSPATSSAASSAVSPAPPPPAPPPVLAAPPPAAAIAPSPPPSPPVVAPTPPSVAAAPSSPPPSLPPPAASSTMPTLTSPLAPRSSTFPQTTLSRSVLASPPRTAAQPAAPAVAAAPAAAAPPPAVAPPQPSAASAPPPPTARTGGTAPAPTPTQPARRDTGPAGTASVDQVYRDQLARSASLTQLSPPPQPALAPSLTTLPRPQGALQHSARGVAAVAQPISAPTAFAWPSLPLPGQPSATIRFAEGSAKLSRGDRDTLARVAALARELGGHVRVVGHAGRSSTGDTARRQLAEFSLSLDRANAVAGELLRQGVQAERLTIAAVGDAEPQLVMGAGEGGNRRADVFVE
jgi:outer membrane protein OmpA-like peptidoglycan-associated protein